jgi:hypothetical protein
MLPRPVLVNPGSVRKGGSRGEQVACTGEHGDGARVALSAVKIQLDGPACFVRKLTSGPPGQEFDRYRRDLSSGRIRSMTKLNCRLALLETVDATGHRDVRR